MSNSVTSASAAPFADVVLALLVDKYEAPAETTSVDTDFESIGFDSLILVEVAVDLSRQYGVEIGDDELQEAGNALGVAELLVAKGAAA